MHISRQLTISLLLSLSVVSGCVQTKPKRFAELIPASPPQIDQIEVKPHPLTLVVSIDKEGKMSLNQEPMGTASNTKQLKKRLTEIFEERERNRVYAPGSEQIAKAVFMSAHRSLRYVVVTKVVDAIKAAGGNPIGLQIDATK